MQIRELHLTCSSSVGQNTLSAVEGFKIFQGENAKLLVSAPDGFDLSNASKVRLIIKNYVGLGKVGKITMAAKEIDYSSDGTIFELTPANTSAPGGLYLASVKFLDSESKILNASSGIMELVETDCSETFKPDVEIADVIKEIESGRAALASDLAQAQSELAASKENAKTVIDGWSDQTSRLAKAESAISLLQADKLNRGALWFNKAKLTTATNNATTLPLTLCLTYDCDDWSPCVGKSFGSGVAFFNTEIVNWTTNMHYGFNFGVYSASGNANEIHLATRIANNVVNGVANNYISFNKATGKHTLCVSLSEVADFAVKFYQDGAFLGVRTSTGSSTSMLDEIGGSSAGVHIATIANYATTGGQTLIPNLKLSRLKIFNCVLPATSADDTGGIGYTIEDYHNGIDEPPTMQDATATYRALLSLQDYVFNNEVLDTSGNGNHASITVSEGGSVKGTNDSSIEVLYQKIASRISNATVE